MDRVITGEEVTEGKGYSGGVGTTTREIEVFYNVREFDTECEIVPWENLSNVPPINKRNQEFSVDL